MTKKESTVRYDVSGLINSISFCLILLRSSSRNCIVICSPSLSLLYPPLSLIIWDMWVVVLVDCSTNPVKFSVLKSIGSSKLSTNVPLLMSTEKRSNIGGVISNP